MRFIQWTKTCIMLAICGIAAGAAIAQPPKPAPSTTKPPEETQKPGQVDLRPKFKTGQTLRYVFDQTAQNQIKPLDAAPGDASAEQKQQQTERIGLTMKVIEGGAEGATIQVVYDSIKISLTTADGVMEYDSAKPKAPPQTKAPPKTPPRPVSPNTKPRTDPRAPAPDPDAPPAIPDALKQFGDLDENAMLGQMVGPMVGTVITVKTDHNGAITSVTGGGALSGGGGLGGMMGGGGLLPSPAQMANWLVAGVGGPGNKGSARVGETWSNNDTLSGTPVGAFRMVTTHTLKSAFGGTANLSFVGHIEPPSETSTPGGPQIAQVQNAAYSGTYAWDTKAGALNEMTSDMRVTMDAAMLGNKSRMTSQTQVKVKRQPDGASREYDRK